MFHNPCSAMCFLPQGHKFALQTGNIFHCCGGEMLQILMLLNRDALSGLGLLMRHQSLVVCDYSNFSGLLFFKIIFLALPIAEKNSQHNETTAPESLTKPRKAVKTCHISCSFLSSSFSSSFLCLPPDSVLSLAVQKTAVGREPRLFVQMGLSCGIKGAAPASDPSITRIRFPFDLMVGLELFCTIKKA